MVGRPVSPPSGLTAARLFQLAPIDKDGFCTGCNHKPTRETGRCLCIGGVATRVLPEATLAAARAAPQADSGPCQYLFRIGDGSRCQARRYHPIHSGRADGPDEAHDYLPSAPQADAGTLHYGEGSNAATHRRRSPCCDDEAQRYLRSRGFRLVPEAELATALDENQQVKGEHVHG